ncbi:MAG: hypothetical protein JWN95_1366 [Frankiales bacterium]|nr:hypothetical protein [Frankiales bacterium]
MTNTPDPVALARAHEIYRYAAMFDLVRDFRVGLNLAFYRTFAVPRIAELLVRTGEMQRQPHKRSMDTGLFMYELIEAGFESERGLRVVDALNKMHQRWPIDPEDYRYVLLTFVVVPTRWINSYGPRPLSDRETDAILYFYRELGRRMAIVNLPATYQDAEQIFDEYELKNVRFSSAGQALMQTTEDVMARQLPGPLKSAGRLLTRLILDDYVARAIGLKPAPRTGQALMRAVARIRRRRNARRTPRNESWFQPGRRVDGVYPGGYEFEELGPPNLD